MSHNLNLRNIKKVGFIENFNPRRSYPEFARASTPVVIVNKETLTKKVRVHKGGNLEVKNARKNPESPRRKDWKLLVKSSVV